MTKSDAYTIYTKNTRENPGDIYIIITKSMGKSEEADCNYVQKSEGDRGKSRV